MHPGEIKFIKAIVISVAAKAAANTPLLQAAAGRKIEYAASATQLQGRYAGDTSWTNLLPLTDLLTTPVKPAPPSGLIVDDNADTLNWTENPAYPDINDYQVTEDSGATYFTPSYKPHIVGNVNKAAGEVGVRIRTIGIHPPSDTAYTTTAFTQGAV